MTAILKQDGGRRWPKNSIEICIKLILILSIIEIGFELRALFYLNLKIFKCLPSLNKMGDEANQCTRFRSHLNLKILNDRHFETRWRTKLTNELCRDLYKTCSRSHTNQHWNRFIITGTIAWRKNDMHIYQVIRCFRVKSKEKSPLSFF